MKTATLKKPSVKRQRSTSVDLGSDANINQSQAASLPTPKKKQKIIAIPETSDEDSSEVEIVEPVPATPQKKRCTKNKEVAPLDDPIQITSTQSGAKTRHLVARRLSFGSISGDEEAAIEAAAVPLSTGKRSRKPSEKAIASHVSAMALEALDNEDDSEEFPEVLLPKLKHKGKATNRSKKAGNTVVEPEAAAKNVPKREASEATSIKKIQTPTASPLGDESEPNMEALKTTKISRNPIQGRSNAEEDNNVSDEKPLTANWTSLSPAPGESGEELGEEKGGPELNCILFNYREQKKHGASTSAELSHGSEYNMRVNFAAVSQDLRPLVAKSLSRALKFTVFIPFINLARASSDETDVNAHHHLIVKGKYQPALSLFTGCVTSCDLIKPTTNPGGNAIKRITVIPFDEEYDNFVNYLGNKFNRDALYGPVEHHTHLSFSTRKQGAPVYASNNIAPVRLNSKYLTQPKVASPSKGISTPGTWYTRQLPMQYDHEADVAIYDARALGFAFDKASFDNLRHLPLYHKGGKKAAPCDLPPNSIVTIGHTVNTFNGESSNSGQNDLIMSLNLHFVILLGILGGDD